ncbi:hypothetical protein GCM10011379_15380 [Filimonas zeae]|uniref:DUF2243 domain-containing protein n=2 Tax=Filimonas zeae TaxID=1737353 RepID=A0A917IWF3_9BACT|nr:hypothetical protein GCM10011379_15380 [Filimonas zeae]
MLLVLLFLLPAVVFACLYCSRQVRNAIAATLDQPGLFIILLPFIILSVLVGVLAWLSLKKQHDGYRSACAAVVLGIGLGGFVDGIVFHQILQVHEMLSAKVAADNYVGKSVNMFWDGIFHAFCLLIVLTGIVLSWKLAGASYAYKRKRILGGGLLLGWGVFNLLEGIMDHHLLGLHNVVQRAGTSLPDYLFLSFSVLLVMAGYVFVTNANTKPATQGRNR